MAILRDQCDVTEGRVGKRCVGGPHYKYFDHTDMIDVNNLKSMDKNNMWKMN